MGRGVSNDPHRTFKRRCISNFIPTLRLLSNLRFCLVGIIHFPSYLINLCKERQANRRLGVTMDGRNFLATKAELNRFATLRLSVAKKLFKLLAKGAP